MVSEKPVLSGFGRKKVLTDIGCQFEKVIDPSPSAMKGDAVWVCYFDGQQIGSSRYQSDCIDMAIEAIGGL